MALWGGGVRAFILRTEAPTTPQRTAVGCLVWTVKLVPCAMRSHPPIPLAAEDWRSVDCHHVCGGTHFCGG